MKEPQYLRVRNWSDLQHYNKRSPRWIKLYRRLLDDDEFMQLDEFEQWQLVRVWMLASRSETVMVENDREIPLLPNDETFIRRGIKSLKKVPIEKFIRIGFLEVYSEGEIASRTVKESRHSASRNTENEGRDAREPPFRAHARTAEQAEVSEKAKPAEQLQAVASSDDRAALPDLHSIGKDIAERHGRIAAPATTEGRLFEVLDDMDESSPQVIRALLARLPVAAIEAVRQEVLARGGLEKRTGYAVRILQRMVDERSAA